MKNPKLLFLLSLILMICHACHQPEDVITPSNSASNAYDFLPQVPYCECNNIREKEAIPANKPKPIKATWGENIVYFKYDNAGRLVKEEGYLSAPDIGTLPSQVVTYEYLNENKLSKKISFTPFMKGIAPTTQLLPVCSI